MLLSQGHGEVIKGDDDDNTKPESQDWKEARTLLVPASAEWKEYTTWNQTTLTLNPGSDTFLAT